MLSIEGLIQMLKRFDKSTFRDIDLNTEWVKRPLTHQVVASSAIIFSCKTASSIER